MLLVPERMTSPTGQLSLFLVAQNDG